MPSRAPTWRRDQDRSKLGTRSVTGTVKKTTDNGLVVVGRESGKADKEWAFALDAGTRVDSGGKASAANALREGDAVTVTYTERDGEIVAKRQGESALAQILREGSTEPSSPGGVRKEG